MKHRIRRENRRLKWGKVIKKGKTKKRTGKVSRTNTRKDERKK